MDIGKIKSTASVSFTPAPTTGISGGSTGGGFQDQLGGQLKDNYRQHVNELFDDLAGLSDSLLGFFDITTFEKYRGMIRELLSGIIKNAYLLHTERALDANGRQRIYESISIVDSKLDELAKDMLDQNSEKLDYLSRVDELRGLILDMLL